MFAISPVLLSRRLSPTPTQSSRAALTSRHAPPDYALDLVDNPRRRLAQKLHVERIKIRGHPSVEVTARQADDVFVSPAVAHDAHGHHWKQLALKRRVTASPTTRLYANPQNRMASRLRSKGKIGASRPNRKRRCRLLCALHATPFHC
jgi:hypothetical protein